MKENRVHIHFMQDPQQMHITLQLKGQALRLLPLELLQEHPTLNISGTGESDLTGAFGACE